VTGSIPILSGSVEIPAGSTIPLGASATLDATKIDSGDRDRDRSLEGPDYFDAQRFPTWTFTSTRVVPGTAGAFGMDGTLTIHGVAQPVHLDVTVRGDAANPVYHAVGRVDRRGFGMKGTRLDAVIGTTADITLDVTLK
jgi:polyisoprenoid-binding protein YceI